jgi:flagellar protein FlgJ
MYSDVYANATNQTATKLQSQIDGADYSDATDDELMDVCKQFESYFIEQMYKGMMKTIPEDDSTSNYTSTILDYYKDQMIQEVAEQTTEQSSLGLAQMLYEQLKRNYSTDAVASGADEAGTEAVAETAEV